MNRKKYFKKWYQKNKETKLKKKCPTCDKKIWKNSKRCCDCHQKSTIGKKRNVETCKKMSHSKIAEKNPMWKGEKVGYAALHEWVNSRIEKPKKCQNCKKVPPYDLANISEKYKRDLSDWEWLCRKCHMLKDGRMGNLKNQQKGRGEKMNKMGKVVRTRCICGKILNHATGNWQGTTKEQCKFDHKLSEKGLLIVKIVLCPACLKLAKDKQEGASDD